MALSNIFKFHFQLAFRKNVFSRSFVTSSMRLQFILPVIRRNHLSALCKTSQIFRQNPLLSNRQVRLFSDDEEPPTWDEIKEAAVQVLLAFDKISRENATLDAHFVNDLGLDSLDIVEIVMSFEETFDVEITDDELETIFTAQDAVDLVARKLEIPFPEATL